MSEHPISSVDHAAQAIIDVINSKPRSPTKAEIAAIISKALSRPRELEVWYTNFLASDWHRIHSAFQADWERPENTSDDNRFALCERLSEGANAIWAMPVRSWDDLVVRAAMACHWNTTTRPGSPAYPGDVIAGDPTRDFDARALAHVVRGIFDLAGLEFDAEGRLIDAATICKTIAPQAALPALSPEHLAYRKLVAEIERYNEPGYIADDEEAEAELARLGEQACELETEIWAKPAKTLADVLLRAEMALHNENGVMDSLGDNAAYYDDRAQAQLIQAVLDVLGGPNAL